MRMYLNALENQVVPDSKMISLNYLPDNVPLNEKFTLNQTPWVLPYSLGGGVPLGSRKSYPLLTKFCKFCDPLPDQKYSIILEFSLL